MSEKFNGFSQEEINKVTANKKSSSAEATTKPTVLRGQHNGIRRVPEKMLNAKTSSSTQTATKLTKANVANAASNDVGSRKASTKSVGSESGDGDGSGSASNAIKAVNLSDINLDCSMSKSIEEALFFQPIKKPAAPPLNPTDHHNAQTLANHNSNSNNNNNNNNRNDESSILHVPAANGVTTNDSFDDYSLLTVPQSRPKPADTLCTDSPFRGISLKDFESHRKMIEEQNKQKKELLYKAIEHHSQKTAAEARKIEEIRHELAKLDNDLAVDVAIIRKQIDNACIAFATIEKQYVKIEAQFLKSKIELHNAAEKKELLTEHLCTVIAHNEDRKAEKLSELMQKVGITPSGDYECTAGQMANGVVGTTE